MERFSAPTSGARTAGPPMLRGPRRAPLEGKINKDWILDPKYDSMNQRSKPGCLSPAERSIALDLSAA
ncbi:MAG: hypothetical protein ABWX62_05055, partial [Microterricola sp.]